MHYQPRPDGLVSVIIDSNVWNLFSDLRIDLAIELPSDRFKLFIPREIEIELAAIPDQADKVDLKDYVRAQVAAGHVQTQRVFGFNHDRDDPERYGGFGVATWQSETEREFYNLIRERYLLGKKATKSKLSKNEGDAALGASSFFSIVLTCDLTPGPLRVALENGGKVLDMRRFPELGIALADYVMVCHHSP
ncbi:hypothetical protein [Nitrospirillum viridazoti]|uniref:Uncharacterized protein n=1 Tax=Nitrospirillum viridazoti CBAmc TaxID=1441467 RepID=A0A248JZX7_9PROT|nr:hypothetical protein [Nitrospirillum amazonense]ASG23734.1 hypothetical protein Y958_22395 [Nitrospirillum amazonense CBAmc]TWB44866.1 hypothetical protein FBZ91_101337 [Nitrospirillum amazonense]